MNLTAFQLLLVFGYHAVFSNIFRATAFVIEEVKIKIHGLLLLYHRNFVQFQNTNCHEDLGQ